MDPLAEKYYQSSTFAYVENNPLRFNDPNGMSKDDIILSKTGKYLGKDKSTTNNVRVMSESLWDKRVSKDSDGNATEKSTEYVQNNSGLLVEHGEGINISEGTWDKVEDAGGEKLKPSVENNSSDVVYYKPENGENGNPSEPLKNPGKDNGGSYPIAAGTDLYAPIDGVKTKNTGKGKVIRAPSGYNIEVKSNGKTNVKGILESFTPGSGRFSYGETTAFKNDSSWDKLRNETRF